MNSPQANEVPATQQIRLEVVAGKAAGFSFAVDERMVFGRQCAGPGRLADDPELSRHHAEVARQANGLFAIVDLSSTNGTFVNGERVAGPAVLAPGDTIDLGATRLIVREAPAAPNVDVRAATIIVDSTALETAAAAPPPPPSPPAPEPAATGPPEPPTGAVEEAPEVIEEEVEEPPRPLADEEEPAAEEVAVPEPVAPPKPVAPARVELHLVIDFDRREAEISLREGDNPVRLHERDGNWRIDRGAP
ncbi:MAG: FHA domain-containing protein [Solirubrobacterales bacterium]|nr:FHA domain-containing protein [Solirubrobacterales bacterium]